MDKIEINTINEGFPKYVKVKINGNDIRCCGYKIDQRIDTIPVAELELFVEQEISVEGRCKISNLDMIAKAMSKHDLDELISLWERNHGREYKEIHP